jgi:hypothetical protein
MASAPASSLTNFEDLARRLFLDALSVRQKKAIQLVVHAAKNDAVTMTYVCQHAQDAGIISEPCCRRLVQRLRALCLIDCGNSESKGKILTLTPLGERMLCLEKRSG